MPDKPQLTLSKPTDGRLSVDQIVALYRNLTGKEPTEADIQRVRERLAKPKQ